MTRGIFPVSFQPYLNTKVSCGGAFKRLQSGLFLSSELNFHPGRKPFHLFRGVNYSRNLRCSELTGSKVTSRWVTKTKFGAKIWEHTSIYSTIDLHWK